MKILPRSSITVLVLLLTFCVSGAQATTIVNNPLAPAFSGEFSNLGGSLNQQIADDFVLDNAVAFDSANWFGRYNSDVVNVAGPVSFSLRFFLDAGSGPAVTPFSTFDVSASVSPTGTSFGASAIDCCYAATGI